MSRVSVLMPVYNGEKYLREAIDSVLNQTYQDFELIIVDDGSTDNSVKIVKSYNNPKIKLYINTTNERLGRTRNKCINYSTGVYLANLDCDDIAEPKRLELQVAFMDNNTEVGVCGGYAKIIGKDEIWKYEIDNDSIKFKMLFDSRFINSSTIIRKSVLNKNKIRYNEAFDQSQDYGLWVDISKYCTFANIPEVLVNYRVHPERITDIYRTSQVNFADEIRLKQISNLGISINDEEKEIHLKFLKHKNEPLSSADAIKIHKWHIKLSKANHSLKIYNISIFDNHFKSYWTKYINDFNFIDYNLSLFIMAWFSTFSIENSISDKIKIKFLIKCLIKWKK